MTSYQDVYDAFLSKILEDEWVNWTEDEMTQDLRTLLEGAIPFFKFPRVSLERNDTGFINTLGSEEIQILASYMKVGWLNRTILTWEHVKPMYEERDFSEANLIDKLNQLLIEERKNAKTLESLYYRSVNHKPYNYSALAGDQE
jgi:hypothetical protein